LQIKTGCVNTGSKKGENPEIPSKEKDLGGNKLIKRRDFIYKIQRDNKPGSVKGNRKRKKSNIKDFRSLGF